MTKQTIAKVILPLGDIPEGATVTKRTGQKPHLVKETLTIHGLDADKPSTLNAVGVRFLLCPATGNINAYSDRIEVVWHVDMHEREALAEVLGLHFPD